MANATQLDAQNLDPTEDDPNVETPLWYAMQEFMDNHAFGPYPPTANWERGLEATAIAVIANQAILERSHKKIDPLFYTLD